MVDNNITSSFINKQYERCKLIKRRQKGFVIKYSKSHYDSITLHLVSFVERMLLHQSFFLRYL